MRRVTTLYGTSIGKKLVMALASIFLLLYLVLHMWGNLHIFQGPEAFNHYAEWLREVGAPLFGRKQVLWIVRIILLIAIGLHILAFLQLWLQDAAARKHKYKYYNPQVFSYASRTMRWGGIAIFLFVIFHLMNLTWGNANPDFIPGDAYHNVMVAFRSWPVVLIYLAALAALGLHLYHGVWSWFQTLGLNNQRFNRYRRPIALIVTLVITLGFASVPLSVVTGILR
ncbi:MAG: succinate dehydrogenase cytochrome b subunit [Gemmatimonadota bacterium]|jgi:succinate dehydrogenase / fumarate reductase cytochrome b subunit